MKLMTPTDAIQHMAYTLTGLMEQSQQPGFIAAEAYADVKSNYEHVAARCKDLATVVWLKNHLVFGCFEDTCSFTEVNQPYLDRFNHILATGWRPGKGVPLVFSNLFEMDWWGADDIKVTKREADKIYGTATVTDTEGECQIAFEWLMETGEEAERVNLPAIVSVTAGKFTLPYDFSVMDANRRPMDTLEAIQEMDFSLGFCADIFNEVYPSLETMEIAHDGHE